MERLTIGLIGCGNVGTGLLKFLQIKKSYINKKYAVNLTVKSICDLRFRQEQPKELQKYHLTACADDILNDPEIDVVVELIGGIDPAKDFVFKALRNKKYVVTANKSLIAQYGKDLFLEAHKQDRNIFFESSVMAGVPVIKTITEGVAGNQFLSIYGIINGTCNYILTEMSQKNCSFAEAVASAQKCGFAEADPTLDINGTDSAHKLAILVSLTMGRFINLKDIHTEGITHIAHEDIEYAENLGLTIKLLAIAKKQKEQIEARVHPTLIAKTHPLASINGVMNALFTTIDPLGEVMLSGQGAGQMAAASGVVSDLINLCTRKGIPASQMIGNSFIESETITIKTIDEVSTKFYIRFMAVDKPGILSQIAGILAEHGIGINSVTQKPHNSNVAAIPVIMITDYAPERQVREALQLIHKFAIVKSKPVVIRMENLS
ncbi:MAG TPA: homoserine dehydrogenase [Candidatus Omnitrophota bacterium]|nr:homoserine dehydrogenase [Candidatus Omnitrophota bacterium]HPB68825.1 homoserine dehydrogenase [Candidatus Omnitrophota bacterium]HQO57894.1 homoserine dehydrogenase [Candidatus Omnitrophota bacterium]